jgi:hypothetical protein
MQICRRVLSGDDDEPIQKGKDTGVIAVKPGSFPPATIPKRK